MGGSLATLWALWEIFSRTKAAGFCRAIISHLR
jgi:hypothetical protein